MVNLPTFSTPDTESLCKFVAKKSNGVCFLGFSRGKDSLCAWLNLKKYFKKVIPFHCASFPGMRHVKDYLDYCELQMETKIIRLSSMEVPMCLARKMYQECDELDELNELDMSSYTMLDIVENLRYDLHLPRTWCAFGISANDSIDRRIYCNKVHGRNPQNLSFYPCYDWPRAEILGAIKNAGLKLSGEYKYANRSLGGIPSATCNRIYKEHYPEDWERIKAIYPLTEAKTLRERFLDRAFAKMKAAGIVPDDTADDIAEEESAADNMAGFGMEE